MGLEEAEEKKGWKMRWKREKVEKEDDEEME